jgi:hypothetical protein
MEITQRDEFTRRTGIATLEVPAGHWISFRHGTPEAPVDDLLLQVPEGKKWTVTEVVDIVENDA